MCVQIPIRTLGRLVTLVHNSGDTQLGCGGSIFNSLSEEALESAYGGQLESRNTTYGTLPQFLLS